MEIKLIAIATSIGRFCGWLGQPARQKLAVLTAVGIIFTTAFGSDQIFLPYFSTAVAAQYPTDTEIKAAYCIPVTQHFIAQFNETIKERGDNDPVSQIFKIGAEEKILNLQRLQAYLAPKIYNLTVEPILIAKSRAEQDIRLQRACYQKCESSAEDGCIKRCEDNDKGATQRMLTQCRKVDWLPF